MKKQVLNALLYMFITSILSCILSLIITKLYNIVFFEGLFWIGIVIVAIGGMSSIAGNASGCRKFSVDNIESLRMERESTNFYANFKKHGVFNPKISELGVILAGFILIIIGYLSGQ